ncbi:hypothetical protein EK21DRAFT_116179 [Setomelanomma holmii]|uniref:Uncharacterized protein n=1 Tax=Setomelanomma holmii TaxID=210430 RepID=A0A9P4LGU5_9PLEO|nr:hypothetical protein EK21DRAFT_116179 [Setomelanomma holmii]
MDTQSTQGFHFLDLPAELRVMVYKEVTTTTRHHTFTDRAGGAGLFFDYERTSDWSFKKSSDSSFAPVVKYLPVALLSTCRLINIEATPIMKAKLDILRVEPLRFVIDSASLPRHDGLTDTFAYIIHNHVHRIE